MKKMNKNDRCIGYISSINGIDLEAKLTSFSAPYILENNIFTESANINSFIKTKRGLDEIICIVSGENTSELNQEVRILKLKVIGYIDRNIFKYGLRKMPIVGAKIFILNKEEINIILSQNENNLKIGNSIFYDEYEVDLNINKIIPSHVGIFGNTGSGKSNTLAKIYHEYFNKMKKDWEWNILLFDLNSEYGGDAIIYKKEKTIYKLSTNSSENIDKININFMILDSDKLSKIYQATEITQKPIIDNANILYKEFISLNSLGDINEILKSDFINEIVDCIISEKQRIFKSFKSNFYAFFEWTASISFFVSKGGLNTISVNGEIQDVNNIYYSKYNKDQLIDLFSKFINLNPNQNIENDILNQFLFFIFKSISKYTDHGSNEEHILPLIGKIIRANNNLKKCFIFYNYLGEEGENFTQKLFQNKKACFIDISDTNNMMKNLITTIVTENVLKDKIENKNNSLKRFPTNIIIDEAHNILNIKNKESLDAIESLERIIKEGRKFDTFLTVSSQRPSDISETILSQLHNYFIHKLVNKNDLEKIRGSISYLDENSLKFISALGPGECIISGSSFSMPIFSIIDKLNDNNSPKSEDIILMGSKGVFND